MRESMFSLEMIEERAFSGFAEEGDWNGWARPLFTREVGLQILKSLQAFQTAHYDSQNDEFVFESFDGDEERFGPVNIHGQLLYPIGTGSWIWEECETTSE